MAKDEEKKVETEEKVETKTDENTAIPQEVLDANKSFDDKINSEVISATEEESSDEKTPEEKVAEEKAATEKADEEAAKKDTGEKKAVEQTAEEKAVEAETAALEKEIIADDAKRETENKVKVEAEAKAKAETEEKVETDDDKPYDCGLDPEEYDEAVIKQFNQQGQASKDAAKALKSENAELRSVIEQQGSLRHTDWLDSKITALGEDYHEVLGEGEFDDIAPASVQFENRANLDQRMTLTARAYKKLGKPVPSRNKLFDMAVSYLHKDIKNKSKTESETTEKLAATAGQTIGGGSKKGSTLSAEQIADNKIRDFDKKLLED